MKQHITTEQLNGLSEKGRNKLWKWLKPNIAKVDINGKEKFIPLDVSPLLSIGQMIEFLESNKKYVRCEQWVGDENHSWRVGLNWQNAHLYDYVVEKPVLCDALWQAVKEVLEK